MKIRGKDYCILNDLEDICFNFNFLGIYLGARGVEDGYEYSE